MWLGDFAEDSTLHFIWSSNDASGASITRATDGVVSVYKDNGVAQSVAGITDTEDFDSLTGIHACTIDLSSDAFYATGSNYSVVLSASTIDGQTVNAVLANFSIENRFGEIAIGDITGTLAQLSQGQPTTTPTIAEVLALLYGMATNKITVDASNKSIHNNAGTLVWKKAVADDGTTYTESNSESG